MMYNPKSCALRIIAIFVKRIIINMYWAWLLRLIESNDQQANEHRTKKLELGEQASE